MSFDLYLLPAKLVSSDAENARALVNRDNASIGKTPAIVEQETEDWKRRLADLLLSLKPTMRETRFDFDAIAEYEKITANEARRRYSHIEVSGASDPPEAQFIFGNRIVTIHWYSGTPQDEMDAILYSLSIEADLVVFDPQSGEVYDLR